MSRILIVVEDDYEITPEEQRVIDKIFHKTYIVNIEKNNWGALDIIDKFHIDVVALMSDDHEKESIQEIVREFFRGRPILTPLIFISKKRSENILASISLNGSRFFLKYPIDLKNLMIVMNNATSAMNFFGEKEEKQKIVTLGGIPYEMADISNLEIVEKRRVKVYGSNLMDDEIEKVIFYEHSMEDFLKRNGMAKDFQQVRKERFVNLEHVKRVRIADRKGEVIMKDGTVLSASLKFAKELKNRMRSR